MKDTVLDAESSCRKQYTSAQMCLVCMFAAELAIVPGLENIRIADALGRQLNGDPVFQV